MNQSINNKIFLIEDHDEALRAWRKTKVQDLDLVHLDAHIDFSFPYAQPIEKIMDEAKTVEELKRRLECSLAFMDYESDFDKQTGIGNYIYPAMEEGWVKNFYWVVPGGLKEFKKSAKIIRDTLKGILRRAGEKKIILRNDKKSRISIQCLDRDFVVCTLDNLPRFEHNCLLDIDTDFLVMDSVMNNDNAVNIGKRKPWISPEALVRTLKRKIKYPKVITIAYSVNGGYTPMRYKHLGDRIAYSFSHKGFNGRFVKNRYAAAYFALFSSTGRRKYYQQAIRLNPTYRAPDNNYGPLYLARRKFSLANKEFSKVLSADPKNSASLFGLGRVAKEKKDLHKAKRYFYSALQSTDGLRLFSQTKKRIIFELGKVEFRLKRFKQAKKWLLSYRKKSPLEAENYYLLGCIFEKEKRFPDAVSFYKDAVRLGYYMLEPLRRILKLYPYLNEKDAIIKYVNVKFKELKGAFLKDKKSNLKEGKRDSDFKRREKKMEILERTLREVK